jgi:hypothetical protein
LIFLFVLVEGAWGILLATVFCYLVCVWNKVNSVQVCFFFGINSSTCDDDESSLPTHFFVAPNLNLECFSASNSDNLHVYIVAFVWTNDEGG